MDPTNHRHRFGQEVLDERSRVGSRLDLVGECGEPHHVGLESGHPRLHLLEGETLELGVHHDDLNVGVTFQPPREIGQPDSPPVGTIIPRLDNRQSRGIDQDNSLSRHHGDSELIRTRQPPCHTRFILEEPARGGQSEALPDETFIRIRLTTTARSGIRAHRLDSHRASPLKYFRSVADWSSSSGLERLRKLDLPLYSLCSDTVPSYFNSFNRETNLGKGAWPSASGT